MSDSQVLIIGAGPVGLVLAIDLAQRGVKVIVAERHLEPLKWPKMERCNARTMEIFKRLGLADIVRDASKFRDVPMDVFALTNFSAPPLAHVPYPSVTEFQAEIARTFDGTKPREPYQLISQYTLEPLLKNIAENMDGIEVLSGWNFQSFEQDESSVTALLHSETDGEKRVTAEYMVGCDGGASAVRKQLNFRFEGQAGILTLRQILFKSEQLFDVIPVGKGRHYYFPNAVVVAQDDLKHFAMHTKQVTDDPAEDVVRSVLELDVDVETFAENVWKQNLLLSEKYIDGRVLIAGDAAHIVIPNAGLGLNTGVGDAADLAWKLAAVLDGWGGERLLPSYETERRFVGIRNLNASGRAARKVARWQMLCGPDIDGDSPPARLRRKVVEQATREGVVNSNCMDGIELGYRYLGSPIICEEPGTGEDLNEMHYHPTTSPGARIPHMWLEDGSAIQDVMAKGYNLISIGAADSEVSAIQEAMANIGAPLTVHSFNDAALLRIYENRLLLLRPDLHVAWRGDQAPEDILSIARRVTGQA